MRLSANQLRLPLSGLMCLLLAGCSGRGGEGSKISGRILRDGQPLQLSDKGVLVVTFQSLAPDGQTGDYAQSAETNGKTGAYTVTMKPGTYRVAVEQMDPYPDVDKLKQAYTINSSPIAVVITGPQHGLDIELSRQAE